MQSRDQKGEVALLRRKQSCRRGCRNGLTDGLRTGTGQLAAAIMTGKMPSRKSRHRVGVSLITFALCLPGWGQDSGHLARPRQLTFGGQNAEAYWSPDGKRLVFQSTRDGAQCDQIYLMNADGSGVRMVSTGRGRTTCGYFLPDGK